MNVARQPFAWLAALIIIAMIWVVALPNEGSPSEGFCETTDATVIISVTDDTASPLEGYYARQAECDKIKGVTPVAPKEEEVSTPVLFSSGKWMAE